jgi:uncharacterized iron-regulated membrane protein
MKVYRFNRKAHYWLTPVVAIPFLLIVVTGILLLWKKEVAWIQPPDADAGSTVAALSLPQVLEISRTVPEAEVRSWDDISRVDFRPSRNLIKVSTKNAREIQIDAGTGQVLRTALRRSDVIEQFHDGSFFHDRVKLWLFFPVALGMLVLWGSGVWMFLRPLFRLRAKT